MPTAKRLFAMILLGRATQDPDAARAVAEAPTPTWPDGHLLSLAGAVATAWALEPPGPDIDSWVCRSVAPIARRLGVRCPLTALIRCSDLAQGLSDG